MPFYKKAKKSAERQNSRARRGARQRQLIGGD